MEERFDPENPTQYPGYPRLEVITNSGTPNTELSDYWVLNASYLRLKNITLGYNLPPEILSRWKISNLRIYASATNLWTLTNYSGYDPEGNAYGFTTNLVGVDDGNYPQAKTYLMGLNFGF